MTKGLNLKNCKPCSIRDLTATLFADINQPLPMDKLHGVVSVAFSDLPSAKVAVW